jgi:16S rRNA (guanine527-N7)-methyltransferase
LHDGEQVLDVGSGGGVPGVLLAILKPRLQISLSESVGKRATALQALVESLGLSTPIHRCRAEELLPEARFDALVARAVGPLWKLLKWFQPHWGSIGRLLVLKGPRWLDERGEARHRGLLRDLQLRRVATYATPGTDVENVILKIWPKSRTEP